MHDYDFFLQINNDFVNPGVGEGGLPENGKVKICERLTMFKRHKMFVEFGGIIGFVSTNTTPEN